ncbi:threonine/serine dehydratase [Apibacter sp. HY039]|uniref:threonine/serine dehydratase n=1 Tax=Apibacter sp. HY039 TaxID=2501476 RepID=UPI000FEB5E66|nr:threonine/serine dehydratase [Apibacter sp. HY039]
MKNHLEEVYKQILPYIHRTPVLTSHLLNEITDCFLYFKCENFQRMGAFKMRGAIHALLHLTEAQKARGVITHSSGNFAQALALAAKSLQIKAYIVMPETAPIVKKDAVKGYGGTIIECPPTNEDRERYTQRLIQEKGLTFIHPSNDLKVIEGQGTAAMEIIEIYPNLDFLFVPVGGGGLAAGTILATQHFSPKTQVVGGEPAWVDDAYRSLKSGKIENHSNAPTIADGLRTVLGDINFPIIQNGIDSIIRVEEEEIISAMKLIWERMKIIVEPSSAVAFAALLKNKAEYKNKNIGIILSGGNVDLKNLPF